MNTKFMHTVFNMFLTCSLVSFLGYKCQITKICRSLKSLFIVESKSTRLVSFNILYKSEQMILRAKLCVQKCLIWRGLGPRVLSLSHCKPLHPRGSLVLLSHELILFFFTVIRGPCIWPSVGHIFWLYHLYSLLALGLADIPVY